MGLITTPACGHLLEPIEETFRQEFPGFDPFPFGVRSEMHGLVRHVLLAEPLVDDFARCFQGVGSEEAALLADSFRFDACLESQRGARHPPIGRDTLTSKRLSHASSSAGFIFRIASMWARGDRPQPIVFTDRCVAPERAPLPRALGSTRRGHRSR